MAVNKVDLNGETVLDLTGDTITPEALDKGVTAHNATGEKIVGTRVPFEVADNAGAHNAIYRGKNLGSAVTAAQWATIQAGTFKNLFIGDYWTINDVKLYEVSVCTFPAYEGTSLSARAAERAECGKRQFDLWKEKAKERVEKWH